MNLNNQSKEISQILCEYIYNHFNVSYEEAQDITKDIPEELNIKIETYKKNQEEINKVALDLSNYDNIRRFLSNEISKDTFNRLKSINWSELLNKGGYFEKGNFVGRYIWNGTCSGKNPRELKEELIQAALHGQVDMFIKSLNEILGNCCISSIEDLDDN